MIAWANLWKMWALIVLGLALPVLAHELLFMAWALHVAKVPEADVYREPRFTACLERWTGAVA